MSSSLRVLLSSAATADLQETSLYLLENAGESISIDFFDATAETLNLLSAFPHIGSPLPAESAFNLLRSIPVSSRFPNWLIFYRVTDDHIEIIRLLRGERDWRALLS